MLDQTKFLHEMGVAAAVMGGEMSKDTFQSMSFTKILLKQIPVSVTQVGF